MIAIVTDSTSDLPKNLVEQKKIHVVPLHVIWGDRTYLDGVELGGDDFYQKLEAAEIMPRTSQPSAGEFTDAYRRAREATNADEVLCLTISSKLSGTYASAMQGMEKVPFKVTVIDTGLASIPLGFMALLAADMRDAGASGDDIAATIRQRMTKADIIFSPATLDFLLRGGRIGRASHLIASALSIKPILHLKNGEVDPLERVRTRKKAIARIIELAQERLKGHPNARVAVLHGKAQAEADDLAAEVQKFVSADRIYRTSIGAVVGTHTGPGVIGIGYDLGE